MTGNNRNLLIDGDFQAVDLTSGHSGVVTDTVVGNYTSTVPTGWSSSTGGVGDFAPTAVPSPAFAGSQVGYIGPTSQLSQSFGTGPGNSGFGLNQYLISLDIGTRADTPLQTGTATIVATVGSTVIGQVTYTAIAATAGEKTHLSFAMADLSALGLAGQNVTLNITDGTDTQILVDNVVAQSLNPNFLTDGDFQSVNLNAGAPGVSSDSGGSHTGTAPTGWSSTGAGAFSPNSTASTAFAGAQVGYIVPNGSLSQSFTPTVVTGGPDPILISLDLGTRLEAASRATSGTVTITASVGATVIGQTTVNASSLTAGGETHLSFATSDLKALGLAGRNVTLSIANATNGQILIDNVVAQGPMVFSVSDEASLNAAIKAIDASGADAVNGAAYQINITGPISLTSALDALNLPTGASLTIAGMSSDGSASQVQTIDGGGAQRGFFVYSGNVTFENLIIQNTLAKGGNGADSGGGGAGLGGGLFVADDTWNGAAPGNVTLVNVSFGNDKAQGGNGAGGVAGGGGGGGGLGQDGLVGASFPFVVDGGGGGGIGSGSGAGIVPGAGGGGRGGDINRPVYPPGSPDGGVGGTAYLGGGGGGGGVGGDEGDRAFAHQGGHGGFGGGGGAGGVAGKGGNGGFGGGGGGRGSSQFGVGGFGGGGGGGFSNPGVPGGFGGGASLHGGGGGLGAGGDIFVMQGATLTIEGGTIADGTVTGGTGAGGGLNGHGFGAGIFIEGNQSVTFGTGQTVGQTTTIDGAITDQTGSSQAAGLGTPSGTDRADGTSNAGTGSVIITGSGTVVLDGHNTYTGDTTVQGGTLQISAGNNLGSGKVALNNGTRIDMVVVSGSATLSNAITGGGQFIKDGAGTAVLGETGGANTYTGGTVVQSGTLVLADDTSIGSGSLILENGTAVNLAGIGTFDHAIALNGDPTIEVDSGTTTDTGVISGAGAKLVKTGAGTLVLDPTGGSNTYTGGTTINGGTLKLATPHAVGSGAITFDTGMLEFTAANAPTNEIDGFGAGDNIQIDNFIEQSGTYWNGVLTLRGTDDTGATSETVTLDMPGLAPADFALTIASGATKLSFGSNQTDIVACYARGTLIGTESGEVPVEELAIGDTIMTASGAARPIKWIGTRSYGGRFIIGRKDILPICFKAGSLGDGLPRHDLWISPHHAMYFENETGGVLIEAKDLINSVSIVQADHVESVEYFHIELDTHDVIIAEGARSETFVDDDSRGMFHNAHEYAGLYPDARQVRACYCAPRLDHGYEVEAVRQMLATRAGIVSKTPEATGLRGYIDRIGADSIAGWAQSLDHPEAPVCLDIYAGGRLVGQTLANRHRTDLEHAGLGSGCHGFEFMSPEGVAFAANAVEVRRSLDGAALDGAVARVA